MSKSTVFSNSKTFYLCSIAVLSALSFVFNAFAINVTQEISLAFTYIVPFIAGVFLGPVAGFSVGVIGDVIGCILAPKGAFMPTLTLSCGLMGVLPWLIFACFKKIPKYLKIVLSFILVFLVCTVLINTTTFYVSFSPKADYFSYLISRNMFQIIVVAVNCGIVCLLFKPIQMIFEKYGYREN